MKSDERRIILLEAKRTDAHAQTWVRALVDPRAGDYVSRKTSQTTATRALIGVL
jgi:hypothetical protein